MRVTLISPPFPFSGRVPLVPPILEYLGALTMRAMPEVEIDLVDANVNEPSIDDIDADLIGITAMTATVPWAYQFADKLRAQGKPVVLGGIHPTALPDEAREHADAVVIGEAESVWAEVLNDAKNGSLKSMYHGERLPLNGIPMPLKGFLDESAYRFRAFFTARGCRYRCSFCSVRKVFGDTIRYRPISEVSDEINTCAGSIYFNGDDNIWGGDTSRSIELFSELAKGDKKHWYGFGDLRAVQGADGERMLKAARASGLFSVWVGWETTDPDCLKTYQATAKQGRDREEAVKRIKGEGIDVVLFVVLGGREDDEESFRRTLDLAERMGVGVHPVLLTPLPGTELYQQYEPYLINGLGWEHYTGTRAVFEHPTLSPRKREELYYETSLEMLSMSRIFKHIFEISPKGFPYTHLLSLMKQLPVRRAMKKAHNEWLALQG